MIVSAKLDFTLGDRIGAHEGRNSIVCHAFDPQLAAKIVVKKVPKLDLANVSEYYSEARKVYDAKHPNVVDVLWACEDAEHIYLAMPLYSGGSLHSVAKASSLTNRNVIRFGLDFLQGLHHVHGRGLVHFDVKPSNILIDGSGKAALADFGISKHLSDKGLAKVDRLYFLHWPPEYLLSQELPQASDIYQAGLTLYRLLVGVDSLEDQATGKSLDKLRAEIQAGEFPNRQAFPLHVPRSLIEAVKTALAVDPANRQETVLHLIASLAAVEQNLDWAFTSTNGGHAQTWQTTRDGQLRKIILTHDNPTWSVSSTKTNIQNRIAKRQNALSASKLGWGEARSLVIRALRELE
jgi:serine/threonine protein kinase